METPQLFWEEMWTFIAARQDANPESGKAATPESHDDLLAVARREGFDIPDEWVQGPA